MPACRLVEATELPVYDLGREHPFARDRQAPLFDLIQRQKLAAAAELYHPALAEIGHLKLAHEVSYINSVEVVSAADPPHMELYRAPRFGLGTADNPIAPGQHDGARAIVGGTLGCVDEVMTGRARAAFNPAGGLHHAMPTLASGFCIYNDLVVGIRAARRLGAERVLYVDFDVHHGDGVEHAFATDPSVLTLSFHEDPEVAWPHTGRITDLGAGDARGSIINVPLQSGTEDASWLEAIRAVLEPAARRFRPDLIVSQHGCDPHREDPLADLQLTTGAMHQAARITRSLADELCEGRWVATGGGGYQPVRVTPRVWAVVWTIMSDRALPEHVDPEWIEAWQPRTPQPLAPRFVDAPTPPGPRAESAARTNQETVSRLLELLQLD